MIMDKIVRDLVHALGAQNNWAKMCSMEDLRDMQHVHGAGKHDVLCVWICGQAQDPMFLFWNIVQSGILANRAFVVFTDYDKTARWQDLSPYYKYVPWGWTHLFVEYDSSAKLGVKPSMRGLFWKGE